MSFVTMTQLCDNTNLKRDVFSGVLIPPSFTSMTFSMKKTLIEDITRWREAMNFMFEWQEQYLTSERSSLVRY